jgi:hypothetical protein
VLDVQGVLLGAFLVEALHLLDGQPVGQLNFEVDCQGRDSAGERNTVEAQTVQDERETAHPERDLGVLDRVESASRHWDGDHESVWILALRGRLTGLAFLASAVAASCLASAESVSLIDVVEITVYQEIFILTFIRKLFFSNIQCYRFKRMK